LTLKIDPRVNTPAEDLKRQADLSLALYDGVLEAQEALRGVRSIRTQVKALQEKAGTGALPEALAALNKTASELEGPSAAAGQRGAGSGGPGGGGGMTSLSGVSSSFSQLMGLLQASEAPMTSQAAAAIAEARAAFAGLTAKWIAIRTRDLPALNKKLKAAGLAAIELKEQD
jgi:hypothetical protein